jgi:porphobilinogen deaminase
MLDRGLLPEHDERLSNALLVEVATECRDMAMARAVARSNTPEDVEHNKAVVHQLDAGCDAAIERWCDPIPDEPG